MVSTVRALRSGLLIAALCGAACGGGSGLRPSPPLPKVEGAWIGEQGLVDFSGADCLEPTFHELLTLPSQFHATFTQDDTRITGTLDLDHTGASCSFAGTIDGNTLTLASTGCTEPHTLGLSCGNGERRDLLPLSETLHATIAGDTISGSAEERDAVVNSDTSAPVSTFIAQAGIRLTRQ